MSSFIELGVDKGYLKGLQELGIKTPTEIQIKTIPCLLESKTDFIGLAQTGTGKTAAFGIPVLKGIDPSKPLIQALILSPTRVPGGIFRTRHLLPVPGAADHGALCR